MVIQMRNSKFFILLAVILIIALSFAFSRRGKQPFKDLTAEDISSAAVTLSPPGKTIQISDLENFVSYLNDIVIYSKDNSYTEYAGQGVTFKLHMTDGSELCITEYSPFFIINGTGYRTKYEPCEQLNRYANELLNENSY